MTELILIKQLHQKSRIFVTTDTFYKCYIMIELILIKQLHQKSRIFVTTDTF